MSEIDPQTEYELYELLKEYRDRANNADTDLVGNTEYRLYHEVANDLSEVLEDE